MAYKRRAVEQLQVLGDEDAARLVEITPLGAGQEVGRSCIIMKYQ
jgi:predicted metal-dependent RNase